MSARLQLSESKDPLNPSCHTLGCASRDTLDQNFDQGVLDKWSKAANAYEQRAPPILFVTKKDAINSIPTVNHGRSTTPQQLTLVLTRLADSAVETSLHTYTCANTLGCFTTSVLVTGSLRLRCVALLFAGGTHSKTLSIHALFSFLHLFAAGHTGRRGAELHTTTSRLVPVFSKSCSEAKTQS